MAPPSPRRTSAWRRPRAPCATYVRRIRRRRGTGGWGARMPPENRVALPRNADAESSTQRLVAIAVVTLAALATAGAPSRSPIRQLSPARDIAFATFAETTEQLEHALVLAESIRTFGGAFGEAPITIYLPASLGADTPSLPSTLTPLRASAAISAVPAEAAAFPFARKVLPPPLPPSGRCTEGPGSSRGWTKTPWCSRSRATSYCGMG